MRAAGCLSNKDNFFNILETPNISPKIKLQIIHDLYIKNKKIRFEDLKFIELCYNEKILLSKVIPLLFNIFTIQNMDYEFNKLFINLLHRYNVSSNKKRNIFAILLKNICKQLNDKKIEKTFLIIYSLFIDNSGKYDTESSGLLLNVVRCFNENQKEYYQDFILELTNSNNQFIQLSAAKILNKYYLDLLDIEILHVIRNMSKLFILDDQYIVNDLLEIIPNLYLDLKDKSRKKAFKLILLNSNQYRNGINSISQILAGIYRNISIEEQEEYYESINALLYSKYKCIGVLTLGHMYKDLNSKQKNYVTNILLFLSANVNHYIQLSVFCSIKSIMLFSSVGNKDKICLFFARRIENYNCNIFYYISHFLINNLSELTYANSYVLFNRLIKLYSTENGYDTRKTIRLIKKIYLFLSCSEKYKTIKKIVKECESNKNLGSKYSEILCGLAEGLEKEHIINMFKRIMRLLSHENNVIVGNIAKALIIIKTNLNKEDLLEIFNKIIYCLNHDNKSVEPGIFITLSKFSPHLKQKDVFYLFNKMIQLCYLVDYNLSCAAVIAVQNISWHLEKENIYVGLKRVIKLSEIDTFYTNFFIPKLIDNMLSRVDCKYIPELLYDLLKLHVTAKNNFKKNIKKILIDTAAKVKKDLTSELLSTIIHVGDRTFSNEGLFLLFNGIFIILDKKQKDIVFKFVMDLFDISDFASQLTAIDFIVKNYSFFDTDQLEVGSSKINKIIAEHTNKKLVRHALKAILSLWPYVKPSDYEDCEYENNPNILFYFKGDQLRIHSQEKLIKDKVACTKILQNDKSLQL